MRLIDADALEPSEMIQPLGNGRYEYARIVYMNDIDEMPTIEPERKKGEWHKPTGMMPPEYAGVYRCSECDGIAMRDWKRHKQMLTDFCPHCGADMRGEQNGRNDINTK